MKLIIGLGNPGKKYQPTRHNIGHQIIDILKPLNLPQTILATNSGYMNESGIDVQKLAHFYKIELSNLYIIHDDLDLPVGEWKIQFDRGPAGHHGVESAIQHLSSQAFNRIRIGIGRPSFEAIEDYVLQSFSKDEKVLLDKVIKEVAKQIQSICI